MTLFAAIGIHVPFWPVWLSSRGLEVSEIGVVIAAGLATKVVANPLVGQIADRSGKRRSIMMVLAMFATTCYACFWFAGDFLSFILLSVLFFAFWSPLIPMGESLTMLGVKLHTLDYGRIRLWGSLGFVFASVMAGLVVSGRSPDWIYVMVTLAVGATFLCCLIQPEFPVSPREKTGSTTIAVLKTPKFFIFLLATALIQASHAAYYSFSSLHWKSVGLRVGTIGFLWAEGVLAEIVVFLFAGRLVRKFGPVALIASGAIAGVIRWGLLPFANELPPLIALQTLHGLTFGAAHLGAMYYVTERIQPNLSATAQGLYSSVAMGIAMGVATLGAGHVYEHAGSSVFLIMAIMCMVGLSLCLFLRDASSGRTVNTQLNE